MLERFSAISACWPLIICTYKYLILQQIKSTINYRERKSIPIQVLASRTRITAHNHSDEPCFIGKCKISMTRYQHNHICGVSNTQASLTPGPVYVCTSAEDVNCLPCKYIVLHVMMNGGIPVTGYDSSVIFLVVSPIKEKYWYLKVLFQMAISSIGQRV